MNLLGLAIIFFGSWIVATLIWSIWLQGIMAPIAGVLTAGMLVGAVSITIKR
ncbi:MAG: hypothetical protein V1822_01015 [Candidatus Micrarchaeota archaeon]